MILRHIDVIRLLSNIYRQSNAIRGYYTATQKITLSHTKCCPNRSKPFVNIDNTTMLWSRQQCFSISHTRQCSKGDTPKQNVPNTVTNAQSKQDKIHVDGTRTVKVASSDSPMDIKTKGGKMIISAIENIQKETPITIIKNLTTEAPGHTVDLSNNSGTLNVQATTKDNKLDSIVLEKARTTTEPIDGTAQANKIERRDRVDFSRSSLERNFITPARALAVFLLKLSDLETLPKTKRRSPYEQEPPIVVYWRKDVESKALEVWGSRENLLRECLKREIERKQRHQNIFTSKRRLRDYRRETDQRPMLNIDGGLRGRSGKVVVTAIVINAVNFVFKLGAWLYSGSHSMFAECIHSFADTTNQLILAYGIHKSTQRADQDHPYGYTNMKYVSSLISGVGIFCVGTGLSFYHGVVGLMSPMACTDYFWPFCILGASLLSEGTTLIVAINSIRQSAEQANVSFREYVMRGEDPSVNVVLFEDAAAVCSVFLAASCMGLAAYTNSPIPDAVGSLLVGCMLGGVASFIITTNVRALVGRSIPLEQVEKINNELEKDIMIRAIHDVKGIDMGSNLVRYKAELDFDGRELTRFYLDKQDLNKLLEEVKQFNTVDELEAFILEHGEKIVDLMGGEIDRIEIKLRKKFPEVRHCDLEIL